MTFEDQALDRRAMHNVIVLTVAQAFNYAIAPLAMAIGGLAGYYLLGSDKTLATLPVTAFILGPLMGSMAAAMLMKQVGRRYGFMTGAAIGFVGSGLAAFAILQNSFTLFCFAMCLMGLSIAFAQQYRFAAADFGSKAMRVKSISWVMAGGLAAAIIGPQAALYFSDIFDPIQFAGSFVGGMVLSAIGFCALIALKSPPEVEEMQHHERRPARPLKEIVKQPIFLTAFVCASSSYMMMSLVMTAAPLAMMFCGFSSDVSTLSIQWHIMAMFAPSFFTGSLIARFGHARIVATAMILYAFCAVVALMGIELENFVIALIALGVAWNFGYIGGTSLVTHAYEPQEKSKVQGLFDTMVFGTSALMSLLSGVLLTYAGWNALLLLLIPLIVICLTTLFFQRTRLAGLAA